MKRRENLLRIKLKFIDKVILALIPTAIVVLLGVILAASKTYIKNQINFTYSAIKEMADNQRIQFDAFIAAKSEILDTLSTFPEIYRMNRQEQKKFLKTRIARLGFTDIFVFNNDGIGYYVNEDKERNQKQEFFFENISKSEVFVTEPFYTAVGPITTISRSVYDENKNRTGTICGSVSLATIQQMIENNETLLGGRCFVINYEGVYISSSNYEDVYQRNSIYDSKGDHSLIRNAFNEMKDHTGFITLEGKRYYSYVNYVPQYHWVIVSCIPESNVIAQYSVVSKLHVFLVIQIFVLLVVIIHIISCWRRSDETINTDVLCGCGSRAACFSLLEQLQNKSAKSVTLIYADLNKFKYVNDTFGHEKGDLLLKIFSATLEEVFSSVGFVGRMGGDEFLVIVQDLESSDVDARLQNVRNLLKKKSTLLDFEYEMSSSFGYVSRPKGSNENLVNLVLYADQEMYKDKKNNR